VFVTLAVSGIVYAALVSMVQPDLKKLIAYFVGRAISAS
jgi:NADH:ubiquinone oxidoreductase subunit 4 (subunit M)